MLVIQGILLTTKYIISDIICKNSTAEYIEEGDDTFELPEKTDLGYWITILVIALIKVVRFIEYLPFFAHKYYSKQLQLSINSEMSSVIDNPQPTNICPTTPKCTSGHGITVACSGFSGASLTCSKCNCDHGTTLTCSKCSSNITCPTCDIPPPTSVSECQSTSTTLTCSRCRCIYKCFACCFGIFAAFFMLVLGLSVGAVGGVLQHETPSCYAPGVFYAYCAFNFLRYGWDFAFRMLMVSSTIKIAKMWNKEINNNNHQIRPSTSTLSAHDTPQSITAKIITAHTQHREIIKEYHKKGKEVMKIKAPYQLWFLIPYSIFFMVNLLELKNILHPWSGEDYLWKELYYILYNTNQVALLFVPYACLFAINRYHYDYYSFLKNKLHENCGVLDLNRTLLVEKEEDYDFIPRFFGKKIHLNSAVYVILLIAGTFFTVCGTLL